MDDTARLLDATAAAARLGVKPATLYAYVSRGLLTRRRRGRGSWFDPLEVDRLAARGRSEVREVREVRVESAITAIEGGRWFYRGFDPVVLARTHGFEQVAELLWTGTLPDKPPRWEPDPAAVAVGRAVQRALPDEALPFDRLRLVTAALAATDPFRHDLRRDMVVVAGRRALATLVESLPALGRPPAASAGMAARLWTRASARAATRADLELVDAAFVLLADHELAASTFAVRIAAALRADPYGAMGAGFGVLGGALHGAVSVAAEELLRAIEARGSVAPVIDAALRRGERLPGFGHSIYPDGDPRAAALLARVREHGGDRRRWRRVEQLLATTKARGVPPPNVDLGVAALAYACGLCPGAGELVFAIARIAGWLAHAIEEYERPSTLRPRAVYTGVPPKAPA